MNAYPFAGFFPISAIEHTNIDKLIEELVGRLPVGYPLFGETEITDQSDFQLMSEIIREKVLYHTQEEVPHAVAVVIEHTEMNQGVYEVHATIVVERNTQKQILIGKGGDMLKQIGTEARKEINKILDTKIHLLLWVKVKKDWRNRPSDLKSFGYDNHD
jgi:GTP-binding protein Era